MSNKLSITPKPKLQRKTLVKLINQGIEGQGMRIKLNYSYERPSSDRIDQALDYLVCYLKKKGIEIK